MGKINRVIRVWCFLSLTIFVQVSVAQTVAPGYTYEFWDTRDGLPSNSISDIEALSDGYVWLTTYDGLVRFNGNVQQEGELFTTFNKLNTPGFSTNRITAFNFVSDNELFFLTEKIGNTGQIGHYKEGKFTSYGEADGLKNDVIGRYVDPDGNFWIISNGKLLRFENEKWIQEFPDLSFSNVYPFYADLKVLSREDIWVINNTGLYHIENGVSNRLGVEDGLSTDEVVSFTISPNKDVWVGTKLGFHVYRNGQFETIELPEPIRQKFTGSVKDDHGLIGRVVLGLEDGNDYVYYKGGFQFLPYDMVDPETGSLIDFTLIGSENYPSNADSWFRISNKVFHNGRLVYQAQENPIYWYSPDGHGSFWYSTQDAFFRVKKGSFNFFNDVNNGITNAYSAMEDSYGTIWATGISGQIYRSRENNKFSLFNQTHNLETYRAYSIMEDREQNMWFGVSEGLYKWDRISEPELKFYGWGTQIRGLIQDREGTVWFGGVDGVKTINENDEITKITYADTSIHPSIRFIYEDNRGTVWFGTNGRGLLYYDVRYGYLKEFEANDRLSDTIFRSLYQDSVGVYWAGTEGSGLNRIEMIDDKISITHFSEENGFFGGVIHSILEDNFGRIWMSSNQGIFWVSRSELNEVAAGVKERVTSVIYDETDGLPGVEANGGMQSTGFISSKGEFWFPMVAGISWVNPNHVHTESDHLTTRIEQLITPDSSYSFLGSGVNLSKAERNLQFSFIGFNYDVNPKNIRFRYKLEGYDPDWNTASSRNEAFYTNVPAGSYTFKIQTSVYGGEWTESTHTLQVNIEPYFYETLFFYAFLIASFLMIGYLVYKSRVRTLKEREKELSRKVDEQTHQLKEQAERLLELDKAKSRFFANISHEFRTPLTLTIGPLDDISKTNVHTIPERIQKKANLALRNSKRLLRLVNQILDISKIETGHMSANVTEGDISEYSRSVARAFIGLSEMKEIDYSIDTPEEEIRLWFDADMMEKIIGNLLSNAFKFTPNKGKIKLEIIEDKDVVVVQVSDSGVGIPEEELDHVFERFYQTGESVSTIQAGTGIGLSLVKELVELHKGKISVESKAGVGTRFTIRFKKGNAHFEQTQIHSINGSVQVPENINTDELFEEFEKYGEEESDIQNDETPLVLIIDDHAEIRGYVREFIGEKYRVLEAENGREGFEIAKKELPDVIICDVMMPVMDGYEFTKKMKADEETDFIPVILLTAKAEHADKLEGLGIGANDYIIKPFDIEEVLLKVENTIHSFKKVKAKFLSGSLKLKVEANSKEEEFIKQALQLVQQNIDNEDFDVERFAEGMALSRAVLYTRFKDAISKTPSEFIWDIRLEHAAELFRQHAGNITEIAYSSGFKSVAHFSRSFKKKFGSTPKAYLREKG